METPQLALHETLAELAIDFPAAVQVFRKHGLDYCCGGEKTLEAACEEISVLPEQIMSEILAAGNQEPQHGLRIHDWSTSFLADFIVENYHRYVRLSIPMIKVLLDKVCEAHALHHPALLVVRKQYLDLADELLLHMEKEEMVLFPAIKRLEHHPEENQDPLLLHIDKPIKAMLNEHQSAGDLIKAIRLNTNDYTPPQDACPTFILLYQKLEEFDHELIDHIHLENNILFKRIA